MQELISRALPQGVFVVTARSGDKINGMTAAWVSQVSFKPALVAVAIAPARHTFGMIEDSGLFCINALPKGAKELAKHFGFKSGRKTDKFKDIDYDTTLRGAPVLKDAYAYLECQVVNRCEAGDHVLFIGEVLDGNELDPSAEPLIFKWSDFFGSKK